MTEQQKERLDKPHPVNCYRGLCSSQSDDYVGMHMSNESCIACDAAWDQAHRENKEVSHD